LIWQQFNENSAARVYQKLDFHAQKAICDEADQWQVIFMSQEPSAFQSHSRVHSADLKQKPALPKAQ
jgi:hypothetical protein